MKNSGFKNEQKIIKSLHNIAYIELNNNFKKFLNNSLSFYEGIVHCQHEAGVNKSDMKSGKGNLKSSYEEQCPPPQQPPEVACCAGAFIEMLKF